jgi:hypothetical protein
MEDVCILLFTESNALEGSTFSFCVYIGED